MSDRIVLGPSSHLIEVVVRNIEIHGKDLSNVAVVFPGKRPAHFLRKELAQRIGGTYIPPKIFSVDEFIISLYGLLHPEPVVELEPIDAVTLLYQVHTEIQERLGGEYFTSFDSFIPIGLKLFAELEELRLANFPEKRLREELAPLTYNRLFSLPEYYVRFYKRVEGRKYSTRALRYVEVAGHIGELPLTEYARLIIAGLYKQTHSERIIFNELSRRSNTLFIFQSDKKEKEESDGVESRQEQSEPEMHFYKASDTHGQVFALSAIIRNQLEKNIRLDERSVIVLPTAGALFPVLHQALSILPSEDYNIALGYPIERTPLYGFLFNLMELVSTKQEGRYLATQYIKFILHPYTKNIRFGRRADITRVMFHTIEKVLTEDKSKILFTLEDIEQIDEVFTRVAFLLSENGPGITPEQLKEHLSNIHKNTIRRLEQTGTIKEFAHSVNEILSYLYEHSTAHMHPLFRTYAESLLQMFLKLEQSLAGNESFHDMDGYFYVLKHFVALQEVPFTGTPLRGLQVIGLLETRSLHFDDVYLLNANEQFLPGEVAGDMLLPQQLREKLELETRRDRESLSEHYFNLLIRGAKRVHIFFEESGENTKSRFVERLLWERQKRDKTVSPENYLESIHYNVKLTNEAILPIPKAEDTLAILHGFNYSASSLDMYLQCPIKFYYRYVMRLKEKEEVSEDIDKQETGRFVHEVLKKYFEPFVGKKLEESDLNTERMEQLVEELFIEKFSAEPIGTAYLLKRQIVRRLKAILTGYQREVLKMSDVVLQGLEEKISIQTLGAAFEGRIDRIEKRGEKVLILDYKTGAKPAQPHIHWSKLNLDDRKTWSEAVTSLQLPMYLMLYSIHSRLAVECIIPSYVYLGENQIGKDSEVPLLEDVTELTACFDRIQKLIELLLREIQDMEIPFLPPSDLRKTCPHCAFSALCGTNWVQG